MEITLLLSNKVLQMFIIMMVGYMLVKMKFMKSEDSKILSKITIYFVNPCLHINSFQILRTADTVRAFTLSLICACFLFIFYFAFGTVLQKTLKLSNVEKASFIFSNQGNLLVPIIASVLGQSSTIYICGFLLVQLPILFSYGRIILGSNTKITPKAIFGNISVVDTIIGFILFISGIQLPPIIANTISSVEVMSGPLCMMIAGMTLGGLTVKEAFFQKRLYLSCFLRLILSPVIVILIIWALNLNRIPGIAPVLFVCALCSAAPSASSLVSLANLYGGDYRLSSRINVVTTFFCVLTIPLMTFLYEALIGINLF